MTITPYGDSVSYDRGPAENRSTAEVVVVVNQDGSPLSSLPSGAAQKSASSGAVANAAAAAALAAVAGRFNYLTGFEITGLGATAAAGVEVTITGLAGGTLTFMYGFVAGAALINQPLIVNFPQPLKGAAVNTAITVSCPAGGAGNLKNTANIHGFDAA